MPRIARTLADECCYHLINRGNGRQQVFHKDGDYQAVIDLLLQWRGDYGVKILAWCLMPNHFHLLVQPTEAAQIQRWMQRFMTV
jgi:putative transposase